LRYCDRISGTPKKGYLQMRQLLATGAPPGGGVANSDTTAFGAMAAIRETSRRIPKHGSPVGIDALVASSHPLPPRQQRRS
jgi:DNA-binding LacI/PurR family transcriptional regulator